MRFGFRCLWWLTVGAIVNLAVLGWIRHLRSRPAAQWRRRESRCKREALRAAAGAAGRGDADPCGTGNLDAPDGAPDRAATAVQNADLTTQDSQVELG